MEDKSECAICNNTFNDRDHRPRALPCGHGFCTSCIEICIRAGDKACPLCRKEHGANSASDLPVNFLLEELLHKVAEGMCPKHKGIPLYFLCKSHSVQICHSCAVIDHPPGSCNLISLDNHHIQELKQTQIVTVHKEKQVFIDNESILKKHFQKNVDYLTEQKNKKQNLEKEVELLLTKIDQINKKMLKKENFQEQLKGYIQGCQTKQKSFEIIENKLRTATSKQDIAKQCKIASTEILQSQECEETLSKQLTEWENKYAQVERDGILRSCQVLIERGKTSVPSFSKEVNPPSSAKLIKEAELGLTSDRITVFMDLSIHGCSLGRMCIHVMCDIPYGQQFVMLALGTDGPTLKGATFWGQLLGCHAITLLEYVTESGSRSDKPLLTTPNSEQYGTLPSGGIFSTWWRGEGTSASETENYETPLRGRLFSAKGLWGVDTASFGIITKNKEDIKLAGYFGDIISGIEVLDRAASGEHSITEITISKCGILLNY